MNTHFRKPDQIIQPFYFGDDAVFKTTCLWLKKLPKLFVSKGSDLFNQPELKHPEPIWICADGTKVHWYLNGSEVCGTGVAIASIPSATMKIGMYTAVALSGTSLNYGADYVNFRRHVVR